MNRIKYIMKLILRNIGILKKPKPTDTEILLHMLGYESISDMKYNQDLIDVISKINVHILSKLDISLCVKEDECKPGLYPVWIHPKIKEELDDTTLPYMDNNGTMQIYKYKEE